MKRITIATTLLLMLVLGIFSCSQEEITIGPKEEGGGSKTEKQVVFRLAAPSAPQTRAIEEQQENTINSIMVLAFKVETDGKETYEYSSVGQKASGSVEGSATQNFNVTLKIKDYKQRFVVIANAKEAVTALTGDPGWIGQEKDDMLSELEVSLGSAGDKWKTISSSNYTAFPMWGESGQITITSSTTSLADAVPLLRMIAKINVQLDESTFVTDKFKIKSVYLYNTNTKGHVVPSSASVTEETRDSKRYLLVTTPTIPADIAGSKYLGPLTYRDFESPGKTDIAMRGAIYTFETAAPTDGDMLKATCLVVGGLYSADNGTTWDAGESYYRVDFLNEDATKTFRDILRNHQYDVNIVDVKGRGHGTPGDAFQSKGVNMIVDILDWDNSGMNNIDFDGDHYLSVDKDSLYFYSEGRAQQLKVMTDYPDGWTIDTADKSSWITVTPASGAVNSITEIAVTASPLNIPEVDREGYFYITAGRLKKKIKVVQTAAPELTIEVTPTSLVFRKSGSNPKSIVVTTYPGTSDVYFTDAPGVNPVLWLSGSGFPVSGSPNINTYTFQPAPNTSSNPLNSSVVVYIMGADGTIASRTVNIVQLATDLMFDVIKQEPYPAIGGNTFFTVNSDTDWRVYNIDDTNSMVSNTSFENHEAGNSTVYNFTLTPNNTWDIRYATFKVSSSDPDFAGQDIVIAQNHVNPSILLDKNTLAFGNTTATPQSVKVTSNAKWMYSVVSGDWNNTVSSANPTVNTEAGSHSYHTNNTNNVEFTPKAWTATAGTPAAGSSNTVDLQFTTTDHSFAIASTANLKITRVVPTFFSLNTINTSIARTGGTIAVSASTNAAWNATPSSGMATANQSQAAWGTRTANVTIPANTTWSTSTDPENRMITVTARYGVNTSSITTVGGSFNVAQPGYFIAASSRTLAPSPSAATNANVSLAGAYPDMNIRAFNMTDNVTLGTTMIAAQEGGWGTSGNISIAANTTWYSRTLRMDYQHPTAGWIPIGNTADQAGYAFTALPSIVNLTPVTNAGGSYRITAGGYLPNIPVEILDLTNGTSLTSTNIPSGTSGNRTVDVYIPANTGGERTLRIRWLHPGTNVWTTLVDVTQATAPYLSVTTTGAFSNNTLDIMFTGVFPAISIQVNGYAYTVPARTTAGTTTVQVRGSGNTFFTTSELYWSYTNPINGQTYTYGLGYSGGGGYLKNTTFTIK
ncbi:hypothetical protein [Parabacteroides sp.]